MYDNDYEMSLKIMFEIIILTLYLATVKWLLRHYETHLRYVHDFLFTLATLVIFSLCEVCPQRFEELVCMIMICTMIRNRKA